MQWYLFQFTGIISLLGISRKQADLRSYILFRYVSDMERTDLLRYAIPSKRETRMFGKRKTKLDLLEMSDPEVFRFVEEVREKLQGRVIESKLQRLLLEAENLTVNGTVVYTENQQLSGICLNRTKSEPNFYYIE